MVKHFREKMQIPNLGVNSGPNWKNVNFWKPTTILFSKQKKIMRHASKSMLHQINFAHVTTQQIMVGFWFSAQCSVKLNVCKA